MQWVRAACIVQFYVHFCRLQPQLQSLKGQVRIYGGLGSVLSLVRARHPRHYPRFTIRKVRARKSNDVVPAATRLHLLPLPATPGSQQPNAPPAA